MESLPILSVVIPCYNEKNYISDCLLSIIKGRFDLARLEIIVVDGLSNDGTRDIIHSFIAIYSNIRLIENVKKSTPVGLNLGIRNAQGDFIMIASAHSTFSENYITEIMELFHKTNADVIGGKLFTTVKNKNSKSLSIAKILSSKFGVGNSFFRIGSETMKKVDTVPFGIYKRSVFDDVGLYDERLIRNHDIELSKRMIQKDKVIILIPDLSCTYYAREKFGSLAKNNFLNGYWNILVIYKTLNINSISIRHLIPLLFIASLIAGIFSGILIHSDLFLIPVIVYCAYFIASIFYSIDLKDDETNLFYLIGGFHILHFSYGLGSFIGLFNIKSLIYR